MAGVAKIAVSVDAELLSKVERVRERTGESRSALVGRALRELTRQDEHALRVAEYVEAYRAFPETAEEVSAARQLAKQAMTALPWDEE